MARILGNGNPLYTASEAFTTTAKPQRVVPNQGSKMDRFVNALKVAEAVASSKAVGAVAGLVQKGIGKVGQAIEEAGAISQAQRIEEEQLAAQEAEAKGLESQAIPLKEAAAKKLAEAKAGIPTEEIEGDIAFRDAKKAYLGGLYEVQKSYDPEKTAYEKVSKYVSEGVKNKFITPEQADKFVNALVGKGEKRAEQLQSQELELGAQEAKLKRDAGALSAERDVAMSAALKEKQAKAQAEAQAYLDLEEQYVKQADLGTPEEAQSALEFAQQNAIKAKAILDKAKSLSQEEMSAIDNTFREKAKRLSGSATPGGPAEPTAPQVDAEEAVVKDASDVAIDASQKVIEAGQEKHKQTLLQLNELKRKRALSKDEEAVFSLLKDSYRDLYSTPSREKAEEQYVEEARAEELAAQTPSYSEVTGKSGGPVSRKTVEMRAKAKSPEQLKKEFEATRGLSVPPKGMSYVDEGPLPVESSRLGELFGELSPEEAATQEVYIPEEQRRAGIVRAGAALNREAAKLQEQAKAARNRPVELPEGISRDEKGNWVVERERSYSEREMEALAAQADTKAKRAKVIELVDKAEVAPTTLVDIMTGGHKKSFTERLTKFFPKETTIKETEADAALKKARADKLVAETAEVAKNAEIQRAQRKASADKAVQQAEDLRDKQEADFNGKDYWTSVIIKNLRKPVGRAGKSRQERAVATLKALSALRAKDVKSVEEYHEGSVKDAEQSFKSASDKADQLRKEFGDSPTSPVPPDAEGMSNKEYAKQMERYRKDIKDYENKNKAVQAVDKLKEERKTELESVRNKRDAAKKEVESAYSDVEEKLFKEATGKSKSGTPAKSSAPAGKPKAGPANPFE